MFLCPDCHSLMWGENCTNNQCERHYAADRRVIDLLKNLKETEEERQGAVAPAPISELE